MGILGLFNKNVDELKAERDVDGLVEALKRKNTVVRLTAAWALGYIGDEQAARPLADAQKDGDPSVRKTAGTALRKTKQRKGIRPLRPAKGWRQPHRY